MLVDSHCHLDFDSFDADRDEVVGRARAAGVATMVTISTRLSRFAEVRALAETRDDVWCSVGIHPHHVAEEGEPAVAALTAAAAHPKVIGIGESGLDYHYDRSPRDAQRRSFATHIAAARESGLPLIVHTRAADDETAELLQTGLKDGPYGAVMHCFSSGRDLALEAVRLGFYVSFSGILTFKNSDALRAIAAELPLDRLLVETDAPFLAPVPARGKRNEPALVVHTARVLAAVKGVDEATIAEATTENFFRLFSKAERPEPECG